MKTKVLTLFAAASLFMACGNESKKMTLEQLEERFSNFDFNFTEAEEKDMINIGNDMLAKMKEKYSAEQLEVVKSAILADDPKVIEAIGEEGVSMLKTLNLISSSLSSLENPSEEIQKMAEEHLKNREELIGI